tara:strand:+ start:152 stop:1174 length:1023 start_codon:yes stop_codon:yes gene_type:complete
MLKKKNILLTFDYELFLGSISGSVNKCLIEPTDIFLKIISKLDIKCIFFIDCTYLLKLLEYRERNDNIKKDYRLISNQIKKLCSLGHYIFPHIHPHWVDAIYDDNKNQWDLSKIINYRFDSLKLNQQKKMFNQSINVLNKILKNNKSHKIEGYRAGGWCIQPFNNFHHLFINNKISADFSVLPGAIEHTNAWKFNFSNININSKPYHYSDNECKPNKKGQFIEFPISSLSVKNNKIVDKILDAFLWRTKFGRSIGDGVGVNVINYRNDSKKEYSNQMCSIENLTLSKLRLYKEFLKSNNYMHFISHPKMMSLHNIYIFKKFLKFAMNKFEINFDWKKYKI